jgi:hypothetical protein
MHFHKLILSIVDLLLSTLYATPLMQVPINASDVGTNSAQS